MLRNVLVEVLGWLWYAFFTFGIWVYTVAIITVTIGFNNWTCTNISMFIISALSATAMILSWCGVTVFVVMSAIADIRRLRKGDK